MFRWFRNRVANIPISRGELLPAIDETFISRCKAVPWRQFGTAYGDGSSIPDYLITLAHNDSDAAYAAGHSLWCSLCHQHAFVSPAALPALPFILEVLDCADDKLTIEILDMILGFARCTNRLNNDDIARHGGDPMPPPWQLELRGHLTKQLARFYDLAKHIDDDISFFAKEILDDLRSWQPEPADS